MDRPLRVVILGGGTAGWMTAAGLVGMLPAGACTIRLIESDEIGTVGVGEATLPQMRAFNDAVGLIEADMMRRTNATFKLGIEFVDWGYEGSSYIHPFGAHGRPIGGVAFHHQWLRARALGQTAPLEAYSFAIAASRRDRFDFPDEDKSTINSTFDYAYHFDATLYARYLRDFAERRGIARTEGKIVGVDLDQSDGAIAAVTLASGERVAGDLFVDCTGFRALLIGDALGSDYEDWSRWLPCDRAWAVPSERMAVLPPYTRATARAAGWQWRIPLQHRTGNGHIYSSRFTSDQDALDTLMSDLPTAAIGEPRQLRFTPGRRRGSWRKNCVAVGLSSGFLEPLESTSIYLIQVAITNLVRLFPTVAIDPALADEFNRAIDVEYARIRDFLILHYHANRREEGEMWRYCREMPVPDSLTGTIALFRRRGDVPAYKHGLFSPPSWLSVFMGQGVAAERYHPMADGVSDEKLVGEVTRMRAEVERGVAAMPSHDEFVADYCPAVAPTLALAG